MKKVVAGLATFLAVNVCVAALLAYVSFATIGLDIEGIWYVVKILGVPVGVILGVIIASAA